VLVDPQVVSASGIVFANKAVMTTFGFKFIYALTLIHTLCTLVGMQIFCCAVSSHRSIPLNRQCASQFIGVQGKFLCVERAPLSWHNG